MRDIRDTLRQAGDLVDGVRELREEFRTPEATERTLTVKTETGGGFLWFGGRRVVVPADEVHVVSGGGLLTAFLSNNVEIYGAAAGKPVIYRRNKFTNVTAMRTITFIVPVSGVRVLDKNHVPYTVTAHVSGHLNVEKALEAARQVGNNISSLISQIEEVTDAELRTAAAKLTLAEVLQDQQALADSAQTKVNATLVELGYTLNLLKIQDVSGEAYEKLVTQALVEVTRDSTVRINAAELTTNQSNNERLRTEAEVTAATRRGTEAQGLEADRDVQLSRLGTENELSIRQHALTLEQTRRKSEAAQEQQRLGLQQVELDKGVELAQVQRNAQVKQTQQELDQKLAFQTSEADATRRAAEQQRDQERKAALTEAEATRLAREESAKAERDRAVKLVEAEAAAQALHVRTQAEAQAAGILVESETQAELLRAKRVAEAESVRVDGETRSLLLRAQRDAEGALQVAQAEKVRAEATRAHDAAPGLAKADVAAREVEIEAARVTVLRDKGLAEVEVAGKQNQVELDRQRGESDIQITAQQQLATLYAEAPILVELEQQQRQLAHALELARVDAAARVQIMQALAPNIHLHLVGDGGKLSQFLSQVLAFGDAYQTMGGTLPMLADGLPNGVTVGNSLGETAMGTLSQVLPAISAAIKEMDPGVMTTLTASQLLDAVIPVLEGREDALSAVTKLRGSLAFKAVANLPAMSVLKQFGIDITGSEAITAS